MKYIKKFLLLIIPALIFLYINPWLSVLWTILFEFVDWLVYKYCEYTLPCNELAKNLLIKFIKIKCWLDGSIPVVLKDYKNRLFISDARAVPHRSSLFGYIVWQYKIGPIILEEHGQVLDYEGKQTFVENWLPLDREKRIEMILKYDCGFDF